MAKYLLWCTDAGTIGKRLAKSSVENTEENRREYRELFYTAPGIRAHLSGAIMHKEALFQSSRADVPFVQCLSSQDILPGIKVDEVGAHMIMVHQHHSSLYFHDHM